MLAGVIGPALPALRLRLILEPPCRSPLRLILIRNTPRRRSVEIHSQWMRDKRTPPASVTPHPNKHLKKLFAIHFQLQIFLKMCR